jgi:two-component system OmpR family response regulator
MDNNNEKKSEDGNANKGQGNTITAEVATVRKNRRRILVIDDEKDIAEVFKFGLEANGFEVDTITDPFEALSNFKADNYDIIISDVRMPSMNGFELCKELAKIDDRIDIFFASASEPFREDWKEQYPNLIIDEKHFIGKPISIYKLVNKISKI